MLLRCGGCAGDEYYSPYFVLENAGGNVYNGPIVSMGATIEELQEYCDGIPPEKEEAARKVWSQLLSQHYWLRSACRLPAGDNFCVGSPRLFPLNARSTPAEVDSRGRGIRAVVEQRASCYHSR